MASILDYLKAQGVDTSKFTSQPDDAQVDPSTLQSSMPKSTPSTTPVPAPSASDQLNAILSKTTGPADAPHPLASPVNPTSLGNTFAGFDKQYDPQTQQGQNVLEGRKPADDGSDSDDDSPTGKLKSSFSVSGKGGAAQKQALQNAMNGTGFSNNTVDGLKAAQDTANDQKSKDNFFKGLSQITNGALQANFKAKDVDGSNTVKALDGLDKQADEGVQEFKDRGEQEKNDPKSALSVSARAFAAPMLAKMGMTLPDNVSYAGMEKLSPQLTKLYDTKTSQEAHNQDLQLKYSMLDQMKKQGSAANDDKFEQKLSMAEKDDLDPNKARAGNFAKAGAVKQSAERLEGLFQQFPDYNIPKGQTVELASAVAAMINGGSAQSQHQIDSITPDTLKGRGADAVANWITGDPMGRQQQAYMQMLHETEKREKGISEDQILRTQLQRLSAHGVIQRRFPDAHQQVLNGYGITPEMISAYNKTGKVPSSTPSVKPGVGSDSSPNVSTPEDQQAIDWANANPDDPRSKQILQIHGK